MNDMLFFLPAIVSSVLLSVMLGWIGLFMVWRRMVYAGIALCQTASLGALIGHITGFQPVITGFAAIMGGVWMINIPYRDKILHKDNITACLYIIASTLTLLLLAVAPTVDWGISNLFGGSLLYVKSSDLIVITAIFVPFFAVLAVKKTAWIRIAVYEQEGYAGHVREGILFFVLISVIIAVTANIAGVLFTFGCLLFPALCGHLMKAGLKKIFFVVALYSVLASLTGSICGLLCNLPLGISIVSVMVCSMPVLLICNKLFDSRAV